MGTAFIKMHGLGNDFAIFDARSKDIPLPKQRIRLLADRHFGIGCDQLIRLEQSFRADVFMRIFNPDGSESGACGNATRCVAQLLGGRVRIETLAGVLEADASAGGVSVDMGRPRFSWQDIPLAYAMDCLEMPVSWEMLERPVAVSMGNPHLVFFVPDIDAVPLARLGPEIANDPLLPEQANINIAEIISKTHIRLQVWERGAGLTLACGTGACATFAAARRRKLVAETATISLPGGDLEISETTDGTLRMTGPASTSFKGETEL